MIHSSFLQIAIKVEERNLVISRMSNRLLANNLVLVSVKYVCLWYTAYYISSQIRLPKLYSYAQLAVANALYQMELTDH